MALSICCSTNPYVHAQYTLCWAAAGPPAKPICLESLHSHPTSILDSPRIRLYNQDTESLCVPHSTFATLHSPHSSLYFLNFIFTHHLIVDKIDFILIRPASTMILAIPVTVFEFRTQAILCMSGDERVGCKSNLMNPSAVQTHEA